MIVGATSAIAHHCARLWIQAKNVDLILIGRDAVRLERVAADLTARADQASTSVKTIVADFLNPDGIQLAVNQASGGGKLDIVLIAHGSLTDQAQAQENLSYCHDELSLNAISPVLFAEGFAKLMEQNDHGTLAVIGSVAGDRGRKSNYVYGAAKGLISRYVQGLQHRLASTKVKVVLIKPGPTDTPMTAEMKASGAKLASVEAVAAGVCHAIAKGTPIAYLPGKWQIIMLIIQHLPSAMFNKLNI